MASSAIAVHTTVVGKKLFFFVLAVAGVASCICTFRLFVVGAKANRQDVLWLFGLVLWIALLFDLIVDDVVIADAARSVHCYDYKRRDHRDQEYDIEDADIVERDEEQAVLR